MRHTNSKGPHIYKENENRSPGSPKTLRSALSLIAICIFSIALLLCFCQKPHFEQKALEQFSRWFLKPEFTTTADLKSWHYSASLWNALIDSQCVFTESPQDSFTILTDKKEKPYTLGFGTPKSYSCDSLYPLIIYLHGGIGTTRTDKGRYAFDMLSPLRDSLPLFLASPSGNRQAPWWSDVGLERILQSLRYMTFHFPIDRNRIFLAGVSDGGTGCYAAANTIPEPFAGFFAISGFGGMLQRFLIPGNLKQRPIYNVNAGKDHLYPVEKVKTFLTWLKKEGVVVESKIYPDEEHGFDYRQKEFGSLVSYIKKWKKQDAYRSLSWTFLPGVPNRCDNILEVSLYSPDRIASIQGAWYDDTLRIWTRGLRSCRIRGIKNDQHSCVAFVNAAAGQQKGRVLKAERDNGSLILKDVFLSSVPCFENKLYFNVSVNK